MATDPATARGPYKTGIRRRAQIVAAAFEIFARRGYAGASLRQIGDAVGMTPAGLLAHFDTKENLLMAVLDDWELQTGLISPQPRPKGLGFFTDFVHLMQYHMAHPGLVELFLTVCAEASDPSHPARSWVSARYARTIADGIEHLKYAGEHGETLPMPDDRVELEVRGLYAMMDGLELQWLADPTINLAETFQNLLSLTLTRWGAPAAASHALT